MPRLRCEFATDSITCLHWPEYRVTEAGADQDVCTAHVGPSLSGVAVARVTPLILTEDGASNVVSIRQRTDTRKAA